MKVHELAAVLRAASPEAEVRIGDQLEAGPYEHIQVGGVFKGTAGEVILCADPDAPSQDEPTGIDHDMPVLWKP